MTATFKKLNFKDHKEIYILNFPSEFSKEHYEMRKFVLSKRISKRLTTSNLSYCLFKQKMKSMRSHQ